jgi:hypothetical protein
MSLPTSIIFVVLKQKVFFSFIDIFFCRKMHAWVWDDQAILLLKTLIPRKGELLRSSAASAKQGNATTARTSFTTAFPTAAVKKDYDTS